MLQRAATKGAGVVHRRRARAPAPSVVAVDTDDVGGAFPARDLYRAVSELPSTAPVGVVAVARIRGVPDAYSRLVAAVAPPSSEAEAVAAMSLRALCDVSPPATSFACVAAWHPIMDGATCANAKHIVVARAGTDGMQSVSNAGLGSLLVHCHASRKAEAGARLERKADGLPEADALALAVHGGVRSLRAAEAVGSGAVGLECLSTTPRTPGLRARWNRALGRIAGTFESLPEFAAACVSAGACAGQEAISSWVSAHEALPAEALAEAVIQACSGPATIPAAALVALVTALRQAQPSSDADATGRELVRRMCQRATPEALVAAAARLASDETARTSRRQCQRCGDGGSTGDACDVCGEALWIGRDATGVPPDEVCTTCRSVIEARLSPGGSCATCGAVQARKCDVCEFPLDGPSFCRVCNDFDGSCSDAAAFIIDAVVPLATVATPDVDAAGGVSVTDAAVLQVAQCMEDLVMQGDTQHRPRGLADAFPVRKPSRCAGCGAVVRGATCGTCGRFVDDATPEELFGVSCAAIATSRWDFKPTLRAVGLIKARAAEPSAATGAGAASECGSEEAVRMARFLVRRVSGLVAQDALPPPALNTALDIVDVANRGEVGDRVGLETLALLRSAHTGEEEDPEALRLAYLLHMGLPRDVLTGRQGAELPSTPASEALESELVQRQPRKKLSWFD